MDRGDLVLVRESLFPVIGLLGGSEGALAARVCNTLENTGCDSGIAVPISQ